jgi:hypothetical protein
MATHRRRRWADTIAVILESRDEQTKLLRAPVANSNRRGNGGKPHGQGQATYCDFLAMHPTTFAEAAEHLEADSWLQTIEPKFGLLRCMENQKMLFTAQQLLGAARVWWVNYTATHPVDKVHWTEF